MFANVIAFKIKNFKITSRYSFIKPIGHGAYGVVM